MGPLIFYRGRIVIPYYPSSTAISVGNGSQPPFCPSATPLPPPPLLCPSIATVAVSSLAQPSTTASIIPSRSQSHEARPDLDEARSRWDGSATNPRLGSTGRPRGEIANPTTRLIRGR
ncbi:hypothetical protein CRG98_009255 [Punica granatum]|uniref:Uncharacterized protein n=1 Tax=Punica granatum TaxID=22663 RepID=A0A2I0KPG0_PUNGR|nr:hypothetical protein CRG98_009255 [Punica granatum]